MPIQPNKKLGIGSGPIQGIHPSKAVSAKAKAKAYADVKIPKSMSIETFWNEYWTLIFLAIHLLPSIPYNDVREVVIDLLTHLDESFPSTNLQYAYKEYIKNSPIRPQSYTRDGIAQWLYAFLKQQHFHTLLNVNVLQLERFACFLSKKFKEKYDIDVTLISKQPILVNRYTEIILSHLRLVHTDFQKEISSGNYQSSRYEIETEEEVMNPIAQKSLLASLYNRYPVQLGSSSNLRGQLNDMVIGKLNYDRTFEKRHPIPLEHQYQLGEKSRYTRARGPDRIVISGQLNQNTVIPFNNSTPVTRELQSRYPIPKTNPASRLLSQKHLIQSTYLIQGKNVANLKPDCNINLPPPKTSLCPDLNFQPKLPKPQNRQSLPEPQPERYVDLSTGEDELPPYLRPIPSFRNGGKGTP